MIRPSPSGAPRDGFTLIELVLATGLAALLMVAVFALIDTSMTTLRRSEERRSQVDMASGVLALLEHDLRQLEGGAPGDLVLEWVRVDLTGDGTAEKPLPLMRLVRQASAAEVARYRIARAAEAAARAPLEPGPGGRPRPGVPAPTPAPAATLPEGGPALLEVCWVLLPEGPGPEQRSAGRLWRGERLVGEEGGPSFFEAGFLDRGGLPDLDALAEVSGGVLYLELLFASQTSIVRDRWRLGTGLADVSASWDAWGRGRPNEVQHIWNEPAAWRARASDLPVLPRRVRVTLEVERPIDRLRRPRLTQALAATAQRLEVDDPERLPAPGLSEDAAERYLLIGAEWMRIRSTSGRGVVVERAQRGTQAAHHAQGALVHHGLRLVREVPVPLYREDWGL